MKIYTIVNTRTYAEDNKRFTLFSKPFSVYHYCDKLANVCDTIRADMGDINILKNKEKELISFFKNSKEGDEIILSF